MILDRHMAASTLTETLVLMILSGIVFLSVTEGLDLFGRRLSRTVECIGGDTGFYADYCRFDELVSRADSIGRTERSGLLLFIHGTPPVQARLCDSSLVLRMGGGTDTLFGHIEKISTYPLDSPDGSVDTVTIRFGVRFSGITELSFQRAAEHPRSEDSEIEIAENDEL